ncbi:MAG: ABC transporter permease subunit [Halovenus sp.]
MSDARQALQAIAARELVTVARSRASLVLFAAVTLVVVGVAVTGSSDPRYLPTTVDLLLPLELLVPAVAIALGYRTIAADARRGELDVLETYPVSTRGYVAGVFLGRLVALAVILAVPLGLVGLVLAFTSTDTPSLLAAQRGVDSPLVFVRFAVLTLLYALVVLAMALAASALARSRRSALVLAIVVLGFVVVGLDLLVLRGFADGFVGSDRLTTVLALSPTSAYRGLVFETVISTAVDTELQQAVPLLNVLGLFLWTGLSFVVTTIVLSSR